MSVRIWSFMPARVTNLGETDRDGTVCNLYVSEECCTTKVEKKQNSMPKGHKRTCVLSAVLTGCGQVPTQNRIPRYLSS